jgi:LysR family cyn operon transcriptional activator
MNLGLIELRHLRYFLAVAESAHFTKAAQRLHVTQPTLSHQIRQLEGQLNMPLFDRIGRRVRLTSAGELLLPHARRVLHELQDAQAALGELHGLKRGELKVGIVQTVNACVIPEIVAQFSAAHPGIRVACSEMAVEDIEAGLESGALDLGIGFLPACRKSLDGEKLFTEELVAVVSTAHPLTKRRKLRVRELGAEPLVLLSGKYCTRQLINRAFATAGVRPEVQVEMNSVESILSTVRQGRLATLLPSLALCQRDEGLKAIPLIEPKPRRSVGLLWLRGAHRRAAAEVFATVTEKVLLDRNSGRASSA